MGGGEIHLIFFYKKSYICRDNALFKTFWRKYRQTEIELLFGLNTVSLNKGSFVDWGGRIFNFPRYTVMNVIECKLNYSSCCSIKAFPALLPFGRSCYCSALCSLFLFFSQIFLRFFTSADQHSAQTTHFLEKKDSLPPTASSLHSGDR